MDNKDENPVKKFLKETLQNKKFLVILEVVLCLLFGVLLGIGIAYKNSFLESFSSNCFTAILVTLIATIVNWGIESKEEKAAEYMKDKLQAAETDTKNLNACIDTLNKEIDALSQALTNYQGKECVFCKSYIENVVPNRSKCDLQAFFGSAKKEISILMTNLKSMVPRVEDLIQAAERGVKVRILTMHPDFAVEFNRTRPVNTLSPEDRWETMKKSLCVFLQDYKSGDENYQIRAYTKISPTLVLMIVDDSCYVAHLLNGQETNASSHFLFSDTKIKKDNELSKNDISPVKSFKEHFDYVWDYDGTGEFTYNEINDLKKPPEYQS